MNTTLPTRDDDLDRLLSRFLKGQMPHPWPAAPATSAPRTEPSALAAPRNVDPGRRARYTLAASVAIVLGTCWAFSNGFRPDDRSGGAVPQLAGERLDLGKGTADGNRGLPGEIKKAADAGDQVGDPIDLGKGN